MVTGYDDIHTNVSESVTIMGIPFYAENIQAPEPHNRREREFTPIIGGTERVNKGKYIHKEYSFTTTWFFPTGRPDIYDTTFEKMMSKPVTVVSQYMGGTFKALIKISQTFPENSPNHMDLEVTVTEVPDVKSNIVGESKLTVPEVKKIKFTTKDTKNNKNNKSKDNEKKVTKGSRKRIKSLSKTNKK